MAARKDIFAPGFKAQPWWWEAWTPNTALSQDPPAKTDVVIVGAGYGGLSTALELRRNGIGAVVLERGVFGIGASTRNGGMISGGTNVAKGLGGKNPKVDEEFARNKASFLGSGADSLATLLDIIQRENIDCGLITNGRFVGAWTPGHYADQAAKIDMFNQYANVGAEMISRERVREMMASDYYYGGMYVRRGGHLHPARYYKGLLEAAHRQGAILCANIEAERIEKTASGWRVLTAKGPIAAREVVIATNGYTGDLTPADLLPALARRQAPDLRRPRPFHRGATGSERADPVPVHARPLSPARRRAHHARVDGQRRLRLRQSLAHGHRPGHALSARLQRQRGRHDDLSRHPDGEEDRRRVERADQRLRQPRVSRASALQRRSLAVPAPDRRLVPNARLDRPQKSRLKRAA